MYFNPFAPIKNLSGYLPHWRQNGTTYFVTFRTSDSLPQDKLQQWLDERTEWLRHNREPLSEAKRSEYWQRFPSRIQHWLDQGYGACALAHPELREVVESALDYFNGDRYEIGDQVVMPNHVHVIVAPLREYSLSSIVKSWKSFTSHKINRILHQSGSFWQKESFDHIVRSNESLERFCEYIESNRKCRQHIALNRK